MCLAETRGRTPEATRRVLDRRLFPAGSWQARLCCAAPPDDDGGSPTGGEGPEGGEAPEGGELAEEPGLELVTRGEALNSAELV